MNTCAKVIQVERLTDHVVEIWIKPENELVYEPGQWISFRLPVGPKPPCKRVYKAVSDLQAV